MAEYIDREKTLKAVCPYEDGGYFQEVNVLLKCIESVPAADVAPVRHGRWIKVKPVHYQCSICGVNTGGFTSNHCPNCGAKMDKEACNGLEDS